MSIVTHPNDTLHVTEEILNKARTNKKYFFTVGNREAIACYDIKNNNRPCYCCCCI